jgi:hypothetical protein
MSSGRCVHREGRRSLLEFIHREARNSLTGDQKIIHKEIRSSFTGEIRSQEKFIHREIRRSADPPVVIHTEFTRFSRPARQ